MQIIAVLVLVSIPVVFSFCGYTLCAIKNQRDRLYRTPNDLSQDVADYFWSRVPKNVDFEITIVVKRENGEGDAFLKMPIDLLSKNN